MSAATRIAAVACLVMAGAGVASPAQAGPIDGANQSVTYTYFASAAKSQIVGQRSYGSCGEPFEWGRRTRYTSVRTTNCG